MELDVIFEKLLLACILGGLIGYEREARHKSAGLRTNILVCLGSCLVMMISVDIGDGSGVDAARIAAQVVSGIGFLGAGAIMKEGLSVTGLTTAACLWVVAGVGLAVGLGFYPGAVMTTGFVPMRTQPLVRLSLTAKPTLLLMLFAPSEVASPGRPFTPR